MTRILDRRLAAALLLGLILRLGYAGHVFFNGLSISHSDEYETIAINLIDHGRYDGLAGRPSPSAAREPAFPLLIAGLYGIFGKSPYNVLVFQGILNVLTCLIISELTRNLFGPGPAKLVLLLSLFYPYFIFYTGYFYRETCLTFAVAVFLYLAERLLSAPSLRRALWTGLSAGLCVVTLSTFLLIVPALIAWLGVKLWRRPKGPVLAAFLAASSALLPSLWIARNFSVFHRFIPGSTLGGFNLYTALIVPEEARGTDQEYGYETRDFAWPRIMRMGDLMEDDGRQQAAFLAASVSYIRAHPGLYLQHVAKQAVKLWRFYPYDRRYQHDYRLIKGLSLLSDGWLIPLGLLGLVALRRKSPSLILFALFLAVGTGTYSLISAIVRYRLPLMVPLLITAAAALAAGPRGLAKEMRRR